MHVRPLLGGGARDVDAQPRDQVPDRERAPAERAPLFVDRDPGMRRRVFRELEVLGHHADDAVADPLEFDRAADHPRITAVGGAPEGVAQEDDGLRAHARIVLLEPAPEEGLHAERLLKSGRDRLHRDGHRLRAIRIERARPRVHERRLEEFPMRRPFQREVTRKVRPRAHRPGVGRPHLDHPLRLTVGERAEDERIDHREHRRPRPDPEPEREDERRGKERIAADPPERVAHVLAEDLEPAHPSRRPRRLPDLCHAAQPEHRLAPSLLRSHPAAEVLLHRHLQVERQLLLELPILAGAEHQRTDALADFREHPHAAPPSQARMRLIAAEARSHPARSRSSCRTPAGVSR